MHLSQILTIVMNMNTPLRALLAAISQTDGNCAELERRTGVKAGRIAQTKRRLANGERYRVAPLLANKIEQVTGIPAEKLCPDLES